MTLSPKENHIFAVMQQWHDQGAEIHIGGPELGGLTIQDSLNEFNRNYQYSYSPELVARAINELGAHDSRLDLKETQGMLLAQERNPTGIYRTLMAREDRENVNLYDDEPSGPSLS